MPRTVACAGRSGVLAALAAFVLTLVGQRALVALGDTSAWFGALHVLNGTVIGLLTITVAGPPRHRRPGSRRVAPHTSVQDHSSQRRPRPERSQPH